MIRRFARAFARVTLWEIRERRAVLAAGLLAGILVPLVGVLSDRDAFATAAGLSIAFGAVVALVFGATMLTADLVEGRIGFFLAQPIPAPALYWGRLIGAALAAAACQLAAVVPALLLQRPPILDSILVEWWLSVFLALPALVALAHVVSSIFRLRTAWLALDLGAALAVALLAATALDTAQLVGPLQIAPLFVVIMLALAGGFALLLAGSLQLARGRTDRVRSHRWLSIGLWTLPLLTAGSLAVSAGTWARLELDEITPWSAAAPTRAGAEWIAVEGWRGVPGWDVREAMSAQRQRDSAWSTLRRKLAPDPRRHAYAAFLFRPRDGAWRRLPPGSEEVRVSGDGRVATWLAREPGSSERTLHRVDLESLEAAGAEIRPNPTELGWPAPPARYELSPDGARVGVLASPHGAAARLAIHDLATGGLVAQSGTLGDRTPFAFGWIDDQRLRMLSRHPGCRLDTLDAAGAHTVVEIADPDGPYRFCTITDAGDRVLATSEERLAVYDDAGRELATRALEQIAYPRVFGADVYLSFGVKDRFELLRLDLETLAERGRWQSRDGRPSAVAQTGPSSVLVRDGAMRVLDLETGTFAPLTPALQRSPFSSAPGSELATRGWPIRLGAAEPGSLATRLFGSEDQLFLVDFTTDSWSPVIPSRAARAPLEPAGGFR
jgi:hypothetical protein